MAPPQPWGTQPGRWCTLVTEPLPLRESRSLGMGVALSGGEPGTGATPEHRRVPKPLTWRVLWGKGRRLEEPSKVCTFKGCSFLARCQPPWQLGLQSPPRRRGKGLDSTRPQGRGDPQASSRARRGWRPNLSKILQANSHHSRASEASFPKIWKACNPLSRPSPWLPVPGNPKSARLGCGSSPTPCQPMKGY